MTPNNSYRISFCVAHPTWPTEEVTAQFALPVAYAKARYVRFDVTDGVVRNDDVMVGDSLSQGVERLSEQSVRTITTSGGSCYFLLGLFSESSLLCVFDAPLLARLAALGVGMKLDFYGAPE